MKKPEKVNKWLYSNQKSTHISIDGIFTQNEKKRMTYKELLETNDFIYNGDSSGLYPASMAGTDFMDVEFPTGISRWSNQPEKEYNDGKLGFYRIKWKAPTDITVPILPQRKMVNGVENGVAWSLIPGEGVYTNVDIRNAKLLKYEIEFIDKCFVYDSKSKNVFKK